MFKASKQLILKINSGSSNTDGNQNSNDEDNIENGYTFGKYQKTPDADLYPCQEPLVFVAPELTDTSKIQLLHFPSGVVKIGSEINFIIRRNGVKGNFDVKLESPVGHMNPITLKTVDPERIGVSFLLSQGGLYKVHIKCNSVDLPKSPYIIASICGYTISKKAYTQMPVFQSDASKVTSRGLGLSYLCLSERNEFTVNGNEAGNNMLFVGICGAQGQCDEILIKNLGQNLYKVTYQVKEPGDYTLVVKWGEEHIPGSPFYLSAI